MRTAVLLGAAVVLIGATGALAQGKGPKKDKVLRKDGKEFEGKITKETGGQVLIDLGGGKTERIKFEEVESVTYADAPEAFLGAMDRIRDGDYKGGFIGLNNAEKALEEQKKTPPAWWKPYFLYWRAYCAARMPGREVQSIRDIKEYLAGFADWRFTRDAVALAGECFSMLNDADGAKEFIGTLGKVPNEIKLLAEIKYADVLYASNKLSEAFDEYNRLSVNLEVGAKAIVGVIRCLVKLKKFPELEKKCKDIMSTSRDPFALFTAKTALGQLYFDRQEYLRCARELSEAIVRYYCKDARAEYEEALHTLAQAYEKLMENTRDQKMKMRYAAMAESTYRELILEFRGSKYKQKAEERISELEKLQAAPEK